MISIGEKTELSKKKEEEKRERLIQEGEFQMKELAQKLNRHLTTVAKPLMEKPQIPKIISILETPHKKRQFEDITNLKYFLSNSTLINKFKKDEISLMNFDKMFIIWATFADYKHIFRKTRIYDYQEMSHFSYVIVKGKVDVLSLTENKKNLTAYEYYNTIIDLYESKEKVLLNKTIKINASTYKIDYGVDFSRLRRIIFTIFFQKLGNSNKVDENLFKKARVYPNELDINFQKMGAISILDTINEKIKDITPEECQKYYFLTNDNRKNDVTIYSFEITDTLSTGDYLGDSIEEKYTQRVETVTDTTFFQINNYIYNEFVRQENAKLKQRELEFLYKNFYFRSIVEKKFNREYFPLFIKEILKKGEILFKENDPVDYIYFIEEGNIELYSYKTKAEFYALIELISNISLSIGNWSYNNVIPKFNIEDQQLLYGDDLNKGKLQRFFIFGHKETLGIESLLYKINHLFTAKVQSDRAIIFKISVQDLLFIFKREEKKVFESFKKACTFKIKIIENRIAVINSVEIGKLGKNNDWNIEENDKIIKKSKLIENCVINEEMLKEMHLRYLNSSTEKKKNSPIKKKIALEQKSFEVPSNEVILPEIKDRYKKPREEYFKNYLNLIRPKPFEDRLYEKIKKQLNSEKNNFIIHTGEEEEKEATNVMSSRKPKSNYKKKLNSIDTFPNTKIGLPPFLTSIDNSKLHLNNQNRRDASGSNEKQTLGNSSSVNRIKNIIFKEPLSIKKKGQISILDKASDLPKEYEKIMHKRLFSSCEEIGEDKSLSNSEDFAAIFRSRYYRKIPQFRIIEKKREKNIRYKKEVQDKINNSIFKKF